MLWWFRCRGCDRWLYKIKAGTLLPTFIVIGAAKCGTSSVCDLLGRHPDVFMSEPKEPAFFSELKDPAKTLSWYESLFAGVTTETAVGEGSTLYTHPDLIHATAAKIADAIPKCRLIYTVRDPIRRLESGWRMRRHESSTSLSINEAVFQHVNLVRHGLYWKNLSVYREFFADELILIVFLEDFQRDPVGELRRCFSHINVDPSVAINDAGRARNRSADMRSDGPIAARMRRWRKFDHLKRAVPQWTIDMAKSVLTRHEDYTVTWNPDVRAQVIAELAEDSARFLAHFGKSPDFWRMTAGSS